MALKVRGLANIRRFIVETRRRRRYPRRRNHKPDVPMSEQLNLDLDRENDSPLLGTAKNERTLMAFNFFSLTRDHQTELPRYDDGKISIQVVGTKFGIANIWDTEVLIYLESLLQDRINRGEVLSPIFQFTANDLFRITGTKAAGTAYERL